MERFTAEPYHVYVTDQASTDGTGAFLSQYAAEHPGLLTPYLLADNAGLARGRNAHWADCLAAGCDIVRLDDKIAVESPFWSRIMRRQAYNHHALIAFTDPDTDFLWHHPHAASSDVIEYPTWKCGASMFIPAEVARALGAWDEFTWPDDLGGGPLLYGWEDLAWMDRAEQIGWPFRYTMTARATFLNRASPATRERAMQFEPHYNERRRQYVEGERDVHIPIESTDGHRLGREIRRTGLIRVGTALELAYP